MAHSTIRFGCFLLLIIGFLVVVPFRSLIAAQEVFQGSIPVIHSGGISAMKQLSPGVGWTIVQGRLLSTNDNGAVWTDITPPGPATQTVDNLFFLDSAHAWVVYLDASGTLDAQLSVRMFRTENGGQTWSPLRFDRSTYAGLKQTIAAPGPLFFVDLKHGWFLWKIQTSSAFSAGRLFRTDDGGATWTELPDPPSAGGFRFHTPLDGWMAGGAAGEELFVTDDGGETWQQKTVPPPTNCSKCRPVYGTPKFQNPNSASLMVTFEDDSVSEGRSVNSTYVTPDGGKSWQAKEAYEQTGPYPKTGIASQVDTHTVRVFSNARSGLQVRTEGGTINSSYPAGLPPRGSIAGADFVDDSNGWLIYQADKCTKFRNPATDGPGMECVEVGHQNDLLATTDGGKTFRIITPTFAAASPR
jgi:photosystem II stability/assembly factor-like uncharacterized protein